MKTIAVSVELLVRMIIFAAMFAVLAGQGREYRRLAKARVRARR